MNKRLIELRNGDRKIEYNTTVMSKLILTQNKIITDELEKLGIRHDGLKSVLDLSHELKKRSDAAYLAVKNKVDKAKRSEAEKAAAKLAAGAGAGAGAAAAAAAVPVPAAVGGAAGAGGGSSSSPAVAAAAAAAAVKTEDVKPPVPVADNSVLVAQQVK